MCVSAAFLLLVSVVNICSGFNVDTQFPGVFTGPSGSYFGYTVALNKNSGGPVVLVGAPKANSTTLAAKILEPGALFRCNPSIPITEDSCKELAILKEGNTHTRNGEEYSYADVKDGMWLGVSLDVRQSVTNNDVVVCGHLWKNKLYSGSHFVNGVCYILNADLDENNARKLLPLIQRYYQYTRITGYTEYHYAYGQAGTSAAFTEDASSMILGAPGFFSWTGSVVNYPVYRNKPTAHYREVETPFPPDEIEYYAYFGYSVTSGKFFKSNKLQYAVGAPRDDGLHGKVYIIEGDPTKQINIQDRKRGFQLGEYFGATVLGVDLNGDLFTELIVGAPLHSTDLGGDEGKVYVYLSSGKDLIKQMEIEGDKKVGARFGTAIANLGDVNQDGFMDIAVGAPYEDGRGAVYIYHGHQYGLHTQYIQKIEASAVDMKMSGFGIHIARGLDIDNNGYPDLLVGSYASSQAVLFRSRPVINVYPRLSFNPKQIATNVPCENSLMNLSCVQINSCIYYTGTHAPATLDFKLTVLIQDPRQRAFFEQNNSHDVKSTMTITVGIQRRECYAFRMYLKAAIKNVITPIPVLFSNELRQLPGAYVALDETFPVYDPNSLTNIASQVPFQTGCGKTYECYSNLNVLAIRSDQNKNLKFITMGGISSVSIEINVGNTGEPAYMSELYIYLPPGLSTINQDICETAGQQHNASLICDIGNPLRNESQVTIHIKLDLSNLPPQTTYLGIDFEVVTISTEVDLADNIATIPLFFQNIYDIAVTGTSSVEQVMYDGTEILSAVITHNYIVRNYGPSPLQTVYFNLDVPYEVITSSGIENILTFTAVDTGQRTPHAVPVFCDVTHLNIQATGPSQKQGAGGDVEFDEVEVQVSNATSSTKPVGQPVDRVKRSVEENGNVSQTVQSDEDEQNSPKTLPVVRISCDNEDFRCVTIRCEASSLYRILNYAGISVSFQVNFEVLDKFLRRWYHLELNTTSVISAEGSEVADQKNVNNIARVKTDILQEGPPPPGEVDSWIVFVGIGFGVLLLLIILILLVKIGFFRRKEKDKMRRLVSESKRVKRTDDQATIKEEEETEGEATL